LRNAQRKRPTRSRGFAAAKGCGIVSDYRHMPSKQTVLLQCLDAAGYHAGGGERWVSARAVARRLSPTANVAAVTAELMRLHRANLVEMWFKGGSTYYRSAR
jgi:hypothetical protein